jgi:tetratricopeptide (TPR) repeat protein
MLDKRMTCLAARLGELGSFVDVLRSADQALIERAPTAVAALPELAPCADLRALGGVRPLPTDPRLRARVVDLAARMGGAGAVYAAGRYRDSLIMLLPSLVEIQALAYRPLEGQALVLLADMARMVDDLTLTALALEDGLSAAEAGGDDRNKVRAMVGLVRVAPLADRPRWARRARATLERMGGDAFLEARLLDVETELAIDVGRVDDALELARRQVALIEPRVAVDHPRLSHALFRLAHALRAVGRVEEALAVNLRMDAVDLPRLGKLHPDRISTLRQRVSILTDLFRYAEAVPAAEEAAEIARVARGSESRHRMLALGALGTAYMMAGRLTEAESAMRESLALHEKILGPSHQNNRQRLLPPGQRALLPGPLRRRDGGERAWPGRVRRRRPENPELGVLENNDGDALLGLGRPREALARYQKALALWKNLGPDHPYVAGGLTGMARAYVALGDLRAARPLAERALAMREKSGDPAIADTELALARILEREDPARAVELARRALAGYRKAGPVAARDAAETEAWLARR